MILALLFAAIAPLHAEEIGKILKESKTVGEFINKASATIGPRNTEFLKSKIKGQERMPVDVKQTSANEFVFYPSTAPLKFTVDDKSHPMKFTLNGHYVTVPPNVTIEELYEQIHMSLPNASEARSFSLFPEAHAGQVKMAVGAMAGAAAMMTVLFTGKKNSVTCPKVSTKLEDCLKPKFGYKKEMQDAADVSMESRELLAFCPGSEKLYECLQQKAAEKKPKFDDKYLEFFKQTAAASAPAEKAADGKTN